MSSLVQCWLALLLYIHYICSYRFFVLSTCNLE